MKKKESNGKNKQSNIKWVITITVVTFFLSMFLSFIANNLAESLSFIFAVLVLLVMIFLGIVFDIIGIAVTAADETPFHSLAAKKVKGAKKAIYLLRNSEKVSNICNDVVGDIAGIISGTTSAVIVAYILTNNNLNNDIYVTIIITAIVAALTVGGKACGKVIAIKKANDIIFICAKILNIFKSKD